MILLTLILRPSGGLSHECFGGGSAHLWLCKTPIWAYHILHSMSPWAIDPQLSAANTHSHIISCVHLLWKILDFSVCRICITNLILHVHIKKPKRRAWQPSLLFLELNWMSFGISWSESCRWPTMVFFLICTFQTWTCTYTLECIKGHCLGWVHSS